MGKGKLLSEQSPNSLNPVSEDSVMLQQVSLGLWGKLTNFSERHEIITPFLADMGEADVNKDRLVYIISWKRV